LLEYKHSRETHDSVSPYNRQSFLLAESGRLCYCFTVEMKHSASINGRILKTLLLAFLVVGLAWAEQDWIDSSAVFPLMECPVSGLQLSVLRDAPARTYADREVRFCSSRHVAAFEKDLEKNLAQLDAKIVEHQAKLYLLEECVVCGKALDEHDDGVVPIDHVHKNRLVRLHSGSCLQAFEREPEVYLRKLDEAVIADQLPEYPIDICIISGDKLGHAGDPINVVVGSRLVRFCRRDCVKQFLRNPARVFSVLDRLKKEGLGLLEDHEGAHARMEHMKKDPKYH